MRFRRLMPAEAPRALDARSHGMVCAERERAMIVLDNSGAVARAAIGGAPIVVGQPGRLELALRGDQRPCLVEQERFRRVRIAAGETLPGVEQRAGGLGLMKEEQAGFDLSRAPLIGCEIA